MMNKFYLSTALVLVFLFGVGTVLAWTGPTANPTGGNVPAPINVGSLDQKKIGSLNIGGDLSVDKNLSVKAFFQYPGFLNSVPGPGKVLGSLNTNNANGVVVWKDLKGVLFESCAQEPGSCPFLEQSNSYWAIEDGLDDFGFGTKMLVNKNPADVEFIKIQNQINFDKPALFWSNIHVNGRSTLSGGASFALNGGGLIKQNSNSSLDIYGPQSTGPQPFPLKRLVNIYDNLNVSEKVTAKEFCVKGQNGAPDVCSTSLGGSSLPAGMASGNTLYFNGTNWLTNNNLQVNKVAGVPSVDINSDLNLKKGINFVEGKITSTLGGGESGFTITGSKIGDYVNPEWKVVKIDDTLYVTKYITTASINTNKLQIPVSPGEGKVLVSDKDGTASWRATSTLNITNTSGGDSNWIKTGNNISNSNTGNVGIGTEPGENFKLDVAGNLRLGTAEAPGKIYFRRNGDGANNAFYGYVSPIDSVLNNSNEVRATNAGGSSIFTWFTNGGPTNGGTAERMRLGTDGVNNVLRVMHSGSANTAQIGAFSGDSYGKALRLIATGATFNENDPAFKPDTAVLRAGGLLTGGLIISSSNGTTDDNGVVVNQSIAGTNAGSIRFHTRDDAGTVRESGFSNLGSLGIGTINPAAKLQVVGSILATKREDGIGGIVAADKVFIKEGAAPGKVLTSLADTGETYWSDIVDLVGKTFNVVNGTSGLEEYTLDGKNYLRVATNGVTTVRINDRAVTSSKIALGAVINEHFANNSLSGVKIQDNSILGSKIQNGSITTNKISQNGATVGQVLQWNGTSWVPTTPASGGVNYLAGSGLVLNGNTFSVRPGSVNGQVLQWNGSTWAPATLNVNGTLPATGGVGNTLRATANGWISDNKIAVTDALTTISTPITAFNKAFGNELEISGNSNFRGNTTFTGGSNFFIGEITATQDVSVVEGANLLINSDSSLTISKDRGAGKVLTSDIDGNASWQSPMITAFFDNVSVNKSGSSNGISYTVSENDDWFSPGARDFAVLSCPSGRTAISGGAICVAGNELSANGPGKNVNEWRISCGTDLNRIQRISVTCAKAN